MKEIISRFNAGDMAGVTDLCEADMIYRVAGRGPIGGEHRGVEAFLALLTTISDLTGGTASVRPLTVVDSGDSLMMVSHVTATRTDGRRLDQEQLYHYRFDGGKLVEGRTVPTDIYAFDEFWA